MPDNIPQEYNRVNRAHTLTRNNLEFAGIVTYFFALAVLFVITIIVMLCQTDAATNRRPWHDHQSEVMASFAEPR